MDPAGPRFVDGPYVDAIPELADNILTKESANFVDIIHTNGGFEPCVVCTECKIYLVNFVSKIKLPQSQKFNIINEFYPWFPLLVYQTVKTMGGRGYHLLYLKNYCYFGTVMTKIFLYMTVRSGTILHIGHLDFYPSGGSVQPGCVFGIDAMPGGVCSHRRAIYYYFHSIRYTSIEN